MAVSTIDALYNGTSEKLTTSATGITVTGTVAATAYTGDGSALTGTGSPSIDDNGNATAITIDSSENVMVGKTSVDTDTTGIELRANNLLASTRASAECLFLNRKTSDGDIAKFAKDGTAVGSTGVVGGNDLYIAGGATGIRFDSDVAKIYPTNGTGAVSNGAVDIGEANFRFKDAYLSGGVYLGGTGSANKLDDFETGTWTPVLRGYTTAGTSSVGTTVGTYTKIGDVVHIEIRIENITLSGAAGQLLITGLPFAAKTPSYAIFAGPMTHNFNFSTDRNQSLYTQNNSTQISGIESINASSWTLWSITNSSGLYLNASGTYKV